ncbi:hypothetical protein BJ742DRAFT_852282 [Cladochytrium replicatum]|nr:hypothetical protein BJ742DRAFT_852282 [Cladochytrium replicatum]
MSGINEHISNIDSSGDQIGPQETTTAFIATAIVVALNNYRSKQNPSSPELHELLNKPIRKCIQYSAVPAIELMEMDQPRRILLDLTSSNVHVDVKGIGQITAYPEDDLTKMGTGGDRRIKLVSELMDFFRDHIFPTDATCSFRSAWSPNPANPWAAGICASKLIDPYQFDQLPVTDAAGLKNTRAKELQQGFQQTAIETTMSDCARLLAWLLGEEPDTIVKQNLMTPIIPCPSHSSAFGWCQQCLGWVMDVSRGYTVFKSDGVETFMDERGVTDTTAISVNFLPIHDLGVAVALRNSDTNIPESALLGSAVDLARDLSDLILKSGDSALALDSQCAQTTEGSRFEKPVTSDAFRSQKSVSFSQAPEFGRKISFIDSPAIPATLKKRTSLTWDNSYNPWGSGSPRHSRISRSPTTGIPTNQTEAWGDTETREIMTTAIPETYSAAKSQDVEPIMRPESPSAKEKGEKSVLHHLRNERAPIYSNVSKEPTHVRLRPAAYLPANRSTLPSSPSRPGSNTQSPVHGPHAPRSHPLSAYTGTYYHPLATLTVSINQSLSSPTGQPTSFLHLHFHNTSLYGELRHLHHDVFLADFSPADSTQCPFVFRTALEGNVCDVGMCLVVDEPGKESKKMEVVFRRLEDMKSHAGGDAPPLPPKRHNRSASSQSPQRVANTESGEVAGGAKDATSPVIPTSKVDQTKSQPPPLPVKRDSRVDAVSNLLSSSEMAVATDNGKPPAFAHPATRQSISYDRPSTATNSANLSVPKSHRKSSSGSSISSILSQYLKFAAQTPAAAIDLSASAPSSKLANMIEGMSADDRRRELLAGGAQSTPQLNRQTTAKVIRSEGVQQESDNEEEMDGEVAGTVMDDLDRLFEEMGIRNRKDGGSLVGGDQVELDSDGEGSALPPPYNDDIL